MPATPLPGGSTLDIGIVSIASAEYDTDGFVQLVSREPTIRQYARQTHQVGKAGSDNARTWASVVSSVSPIGRAEDPSLGSCELSHIRYVYELTVYPHRQKFRLKV